MRITRRLALGVNDGIRNLRFQEAAKASWTARRHPPGTARSVPDPSGTLRTDLTIGDRQKRQRTKIEFLFCTLLTMLLALPVAVTADDGLPTRLHAHPDRDSDGPYWVAATCAVRPDGTVRGEQHIGALARHLAEWLNSPRVRSATPEEETLDSADLGCEVTPEKAQSIRERYMLLPQEVFPPGDFRGWVSASDAVVSATVAGLVPGFDQHGSPNTLVVLKDTEHLYPSLKYQPFVKYAILPYARFIVGGKIVCAPKDISLEYYPEVGDRLLIAADVPADRDGTAMTAMGMSRVVLG